jgi:hypothetical protein
MGQENDKRETRLKSQDRMCSCFDVGAFQKNEQNYCVIARYKAPSKSPQKGETLKSILKPSPWRGLGEASCFSPRNCAANKIPIAPEITSRHGL